jgi:DinB superfamily
MPIEILNRTLDFFVNELSKYTFPQLLAKPSPDHWSLGQMYTHLIDDAGFYVEQIKICAETNDHADEEMSANAKEMFRNNAFPDEKIEGSPSNAFIPQPKSKEKLMIALLHLKKELNDAAVLISATPVKGKSKHPGLNYFSAEEWLQFADMHFRHHLRQKKRLDDFLTASKIL